MRQGKSKAMKTPEELVTRSQKREPLSARVKADTKGVLTKAAEKAGTSLSDLAAAILDDYAEWLVSTRKRKK
jgi:uncharacterized protein (DUF1778 family)